MADVLIAGSGIAGSALAILLGRRGFQVELFERGHFPKEKPCGEGLMPAGLAALDRLGVGRAVGGTPFHGVRYHFESQIIHGKFPKVSGMPVAGCGQRRWHLDRVLFLAAASTPGVRAHTGVRVDAPLRENGGRVVGLRVNGEVCHAPLVVAADGAQSRLRQLMNLNAPVQRKRVGVRAHFLLAKDQDQCHWVDVFIGRGHELYVTPLPDNEILIAGLTDAKALTLPVHRAFMSWVSAQPKLVWRLKGAEQVSPILATSPLAPRARIGVAPGLVLLGDAAGCLDPITGGGMTHALLTAELLAFCMPDRLESRNDSWLWKFERARHALLRDYRILTHSILWLCDRPWLAERLFPLAKVLPEFWSHLIGVSGGVRRLVAFPWSPKLDIEAVDRIRGVLAPTSPQSTPLCPE